MRFEMIPAVTLVAVLAAFTCGEASACPEKKKGDGKKSVVLLDRVKVDGVKKENVDREARKAAPGRRGNLDRARSRGKGGSCPCCQAGVAPRAPRGPRAPRVERAPRPPRGPRGPRAEALSGAPRRPRIEAAPSTRRPRHEARPAPPSSKGAPRKGAKGKAGKAGDSDDRRIDVI